MSNVHDLLEAHGKASIEVYLDWENGSIVAPEVFEAMKEIFLQRAYGNPAITHRIGWETYELFVKSKETIAESLNIKGEQLALTHTNAEANNLAIKGLAKKHKKRKKIIVSAVEHLSVIHSAKALQEANISVELIPVAQDGTIDTDVLQDKVDSNTLLVSIQVANHEIGTIQPLQEAIDIVKDKDENIFFHTDATAAYGRIPLDFGKLNIDLATISSRHILGPKGIASLYLKEGVKVSPLYDGQVNIETLVPDVENMPLLVGFAKAVEEQFKNFEEIKAHTMKLRDRLLYELQTHIPRTEINGAVGKRRLPDNANLSFMGCEGEALTVESSMNGIYVSSGSACTSRILMPSHILTAIGRKPEEAHGSVLMKVNRLNTEEQINYVIETMPKVVQRIRSITGGIEL
ncbi:MAG: cysteine desulfurase family protein [Candidatus Heimdallarchaeaceae archaeon]